MSGLILPSNHKEGDRYPPESLILLMEGKIWRTNLPYGTPVEIIGSSDSIIVRTPTWNAPIPPQTLFQTRNNLIATGPDGTLLDNYIKKPPKPEPGSIPDDFDFSTED